MDRLFEAVHHAEDVPVFSIEAATIIRLTRGWEFFDRNNRTIGMFTPSRPMDFDIVMSSID